MTKRKVPRQPKTIKVTFSVEAEQGAAQLFFTAPEGYAATSLQRKGTKVVVTYERIAS